MLGFEFVEQIPELIVMKALLDGISHVAAKSARASPGADGLSQLPRQGDADFLHPSVQARPVGSTLTTRSSTCSREYDSSARLIASSRALSGGRDSSSSCAAAAMASCYHR